MRPVRGRLRQVRPKGEALVFQYNPTSITVGGGGTRYDVVERPLRKSSLVYGGQDLEIITFSLFIDGFPGRSIESDLEILRQMSRPVKKERRGPLLRFDYGPRTPDTLWVIADDGLEWGPELRRSDLLRVRQDLTITLLEYQEPDLSVSPIKKHRGDSTGRETHTVSQGETLVSIAIEEFGDSERWTDIADLNGIRDPRALSEGLELVLPEA